MKSSSYNIVFEHRGHDYVYNARTNALASVAPEVAAFIRNAIPGRPIGDISHDACAPLLRGGFLIEDDFDELLRLKVRNRIGRYSGNSLGLTIAPTLACNFRCTYCFEDLNQEVMNDETAEAVYGFVVNSLRNVERFGVCWYGGEPLLALDTIKRLSRRFIDLARLMGIDYDADIISNGYLMTPDVAKTLTQQCRVTFWQVTLDGPPEVHDQRRRRRRGGPTFATILDNVKASYQFFQRVAIRINVDKQNVGDVPRLLDILDDSGLKNKVAVYLGHVQNVGATCPSIAPTCFAVDEFADIEVETYRLFAARGFDVSLRSGLRSAVCMADRKDSYLIDQRGNLSKCWNLVGKDAHRIGTVFDSELNDRSLAWLGYDPFEDSDCRSCNILPLCMGGCPHEAVVRRAKECSPLKHNLIGRIKLRLDIAANAAAGDGDTPEADPDKPPTCIAHQPPHPPACICHGAYCPHERPPCDFRCERDCNTMCHCREHRIEDRTSGRDQGASP